MSLNDDSLLQNEFLSDCHQLFSRRDGILIILKRHPSEIKHPKFENVSMNGMSTEITEVMTNRYNPTNKGESPFSAHFLCLWQASAVVVNWNGPGNQLIETPRQCHSHKPQPIPDTKRKRKWT